MMPKLKMQLFTKATTIVSLLFLAYTLNCFAGSSSDKLTSVIALQRLDGDEAGTASGTVLITKDSSVQEFHVSVAGVPQGSPAGGLAVFIGAAPYDTNNFIFVNTLDGPGETGTWSLDLVGEKSAPVQLGVDDVEALTNRFVMIADVSSNAYLQTIIPEFVEKPAKVGYRAHVRMTIPDPAPSPKAKGIVNIRLDGKKGTSFVQTRCRGLSAGNSYCMWIVDYVGKAVDPCLGPKTPNGEFLSTSDTAKGEQIAIGAVLNDHARIDQEAGRFIKIIDEFGQVHMWARIPGHP